MSGEVETAPKDEEDPGGVKAYSPDQPGGRIIRGRMPTMEMINDRFAPTVYFWTSLLREDRNLVSSARKSSSSAISFQKVPVPSSFNLFCDGAVARNGLYIMDAMLVYLIVDFFFGGKVQTHVKPEGREFTRFKSG